MAITYKVWDLPRLPVEGQLFSVPGAAFDGGFTSGGARIVSPEPGGRCMIEMQLSLQTDQWDFPFMSWLMSKINGEIIRVPLTKTPQLVNDRALGYDVAIGSYNTPGIPWAALLDGGSPSPWDNGQYWYNDAIVGLASGLSLAGTTQFYISNLDGINDILRPGHVIGHTEYTYLIEDIEYFDDLTAFVTVTPPLRVDMVNLDIIKFRPSMLGMIGNGDEIKQMYEADKVGHIRPGRIIFHEVDVQL